MKFRCADFPITFPFSSAICFAFAANINICDFLPKDTSQFFEHCSHNSLKDFANTSFQSVDNALMLLSSTSFELDDLDQGDHDSLDSWVHHLLLAVDHVSMPLFSAFFLLLHLFFFLMFVANREPFLFPLLQTEKPEMRSKLNSPPYCSYSAPSCSETVACDILLSRLFKCFRGIFCSTDRGTEQTNALLRTHIQIRLDHDEILFFVFEPLFATCLTRFPSSRDAGCTSQRSPIYAAGGSSAGALYTQNRLPPLNFVSGGPLP